MKFLTEQNPRERLYSVSEQMSESMNQRNFLQKKEEEEVKEKR